MARKYKWEMFVDKVLAGSTQRDAYKSTFNCSKMSEKQIDAEASNMLNGTGKYKKNPKASIRYKELNEKVKEQDDGNAIADAKEIMEYLTSVLRGESRSEVVVVEGTGEGCSEARAMMKGPDEKERLKSAELLGKRYALFTEKIENDVDMELKITVDYGDDDS